MELEKESQEDGTTKREYNGAVEKMLLSTRACRQVI
jgi:hypothetical protein